MGKKSSNDVNSEKYFLWILIILIVAAFLAFGWYYWHAHYGPGPRISMGAGIGL